MHSLPSLQLLDPRICILGPSNSGKSTLAQATGVILLDCSTLMSIIRYFNEHGFKNQNDSALYLVIKIVSNGICCNIL